MALLVLPGSPAMGRLVAAAALLFGLAGASLCSAAESTFSGNYSVQLPTGWKGELQKDQALIGSGPGDVSFGLKAYPADITPEEYVDKALANTEKRPGYKLIEKTAVKTSSGAKAQRVRYQVDGAKGPEYLVKFYFQLVEKQVVVLLFQLPNFSSTASKTDIEAIFNSVKASKTTSQEDSWATPSQEKPKADSKKGGDDDSDAALQVLNLMKLAGKYVSSSRASDYMTLKADGTFAFEMRGESGTGTYTSNGSTLTFKFSASDTDSAKLEKDAFVDAQGNRWVKKP